MTESVKDFLVVLSKGEVELDNGVIFLIDEQFEDDKGNIQFTVQRRDVNVERTPGNYLLKQIFGVQTFKGKDEVEKKRKCIFRQENIMLLGRNSPRTYLAWADSYDELPAGVKANKKWATILDMTYSADEKIEQEIHAMKNAQISEGEIFNTATSSPTKYFENNLDYLKRFVELKLDSAGIQKPVAGQAQLPANPMSQ